MYETIRKIARLKAKEVSNRKIGSMEGYPSREKVGKIVNRINESGYDYSTISRMPDVELEKIFSTKKSNPKRETDYVMPDFKILAKELAKKGVTMNLLWEEYCDSCRLSNQKNYQKTQFVKYFKEYLGKNEFTDIIHHKAGEKIEVDWAGTKAHWIDPDTGEIVEGYLFVGILPFSGYSFAKVYPDMKSEKWIKAHIEMFEYFGGVTQLLVSDNLKTGVIKHTKNELVLNRLYEDMAEHYGTIIVPTRVRSPKDKATVENTVGKLTTYIIAKMRNYQFFSIDEYNEMLSKKLESFNNKPFQKKEGSRKSIFDDYEKETLIPLNPIPYEVSVWKKAKVQNNSHIAFQKNYYSVPYEHIGKEVNLKINSSSIKVYFNGEVISEHEIIKNRIGLYKTKSEHMPENSTQFSEWNSTRFLNWAKQKGPFTYQVVYTLFSSSKHEQQCYQTVHSILKLADVYSNERLESACRYALTLFQRPVYKNIKAILKNKEDLCQESRNEEILSSRFLRGGEYYDR